jgi:aspartyl-tRNA(Asn)/glutamyl-tRNA(Gln) amidotransferase subunit C
MAHAVEVHNVFADDVVEPSLPREAALSNAPRHNDRGYLVPPVLGE